MKLFRFILVTLFSSIFCFTTLHATDLGKEIEYKVQYEKAWNVKSFSCQDGNILMTYSVELPYKNTNGIFELITTDGQSISKGELGRITNILGMIEFEKNYVFLAIAPETFVEKNFYSRMPGNYQVITVNKSNFEIKSADFFKYLIKQDKSIKNLLGTKQFSMSSGHQIFITTDALIVHYIVKKHLNIVTINNSGIDKKSIPLHDYDHRIALTTSSFNFYESDKKLSIFDNLSDNKVYKTSDNELVYIYKNSKSWIKGNHVYDIKSINFVKVNLATKSFESYEFPYQNNKSDAIYFDEKIWVYGIQDNIFQLNVLNPITKKNEVNYLARSTDDFSTLLADNAADFYADKGKEILTEPNVIFDNLYSKSGKGIIGSKNWEAGMSITKIDGIYHIEIASLAVERDFKYIWNTRYNINNFYWNKTFRPTFSFSFPTGSINTENYNSWVSNSKIDWITSWTRKDEKWGTYFSIQLNEALKIDKKPIDKLPIESNLEMKKKIRDSIIDRFGSDKLVSAYELSHQGKTIIFYTVRGENRSIFISISE